MQKARNLVALISILIVTASAVLAGGDDSRPLVEILFERAGKGDVMGLKALSPEVEAARSPVVLYAFRLARYISDPDKNAAQFVAEFPEDAAGVMGAAYKIEIASAADGKRLTPRFLYSFDELGKLAERGAPGAVRKLLIVAGSSDGVVTEFVCERIMKVLARQPAESVDALSTIRDDQRSKTYGCFESASADELKAARVSLSALQVGKRNEVSRELLRAVRDNHTPIK